MTFAGMEGVQMLEESAGNYSAQEQVTSAFCASTNVWDKNWMQ